MEHEDDSLKGVQAAIAGQILSSWLPIGNGRKIVFFVLLGLGVYGMVIGKYEMLVYFPIAALFSPRLVGMAAFNLGRLVRSMRRK